MTEKQYKNAIIKDMKNVGTYKEEFSIAVNTLAKIMFDYQETMGEFEKTGGNIIITHTNKSKEKNVVKNPFYLAIETLRAQILKYLIELGLTPAGLKKINDKSLAVQKESLLGKALRDRKSVV